MLPFSADGVSIPISDDNPAPRLHRKIRRHGTNNMRRRIVGNLIRWWMSLLLLAAVALLLFEASSFSRNPPTPVDFNVSEVSSRLKRVRVSSGGERCLKLLDDERIASLEFPARNGLDFPVKKVEYRSGSWTPRFGAAAPLLESVGGSRFNSFTGGQNMDEREESFKVNETAIVHCGFYSEIGGFDISEDDKDYMLKCEAVVSTCAFGGGDDLYQPIGMTQTSIDKVCYVAFWDNITQSTQKVEGKHMQDNRMIGLWRIVVVKNLPFADQRLNGKIPKLLSHRLFPQARYSIWVDSKSQFRKDPLGVLEALLWRTGSVLAISEHGARSNVYEEGTAIVKKHKATPVEVEIQLSQYRADEFTDIKRFNGKKALSEASVIVREHTPGTNLLMCLWFNEVARFTARDQLSFPYVLRRLNVTGINMFPVCTRKALVNSMGHKRKVKPLVI